MDQTLLRHRTRRHSLYKQGESEISRLMGDDTKTQTRLIGQWRAFCAWLMVNHGESPEAITRVTREQVILYGQHLKSEFDNGRLANTNTVASYLSGMNTLMKRVNPDWEKVSAVKECGLETISHISNKEPELDKNGLPDIESRLN